MTKAEKMLMKAWERSIYMDAWLAQCLNSDRRPHITDLLYLGRLTGSYGDYIIYQDRVTGDYVCEYERRD